MEGGGPRAQFLASP